jgi:hypothetical protein
MGRLQRGSSTALGRTTVRHTQAQDGGFWREPPFLHPHRNGVTWSNADIAALIAPTSAFIFSVSDSGQAETAGRGRLMPQAE